MMIASSSSSTLPAPPPEPVLAIIERSILVKQGAEAKIYKSKPLDHPILTIPSSSKPSNSDTNTNTDEVTSNPALPSLLVKHRFKKTYRHPSLDQSLTKSRIQHEVRALVRCERGGVVVPGVRFTHPPSGLLLMEWIEGPSVRELLKFFEREEKEKEKQERRRLGDRRGVTVTGEDEMEDSSSSEDEGEDGKVIRRDGEGEEEEWKKWVGKIDQNCLMHLVGIEIGKMHRLCDTIHGDLTTSNMMVRRRRRQQQQHPTTTFPTSTTSTSSPSMEIEIVLIDFGLSFSSPLPEDQAVDLYVLERAFLSTHPEAGKLFEMVMDGYREEIKKGRPKSSKSKGEGGGRKGRNREKKEDSEEVGGGGGRNGKEEWERVRRKLDEVRLRGRKRSMVG